MPKIAEVSYYCGRASSRGCIPLSATEYYELSDWAGRQFWADKCGIIPAELAPILERLSVNSNTWMRLVKSFRNLFRQAAGRPASLGKEATRRGQRWLQGSSKSHSLFSA